MRSYYIEHKFILNNILLYLQTSNRRYLEVAQSEIRHAKELDFKIKTQTEYEKKEDVDSSHGPGRMTMFLLNSKGELYFNGGTLTIYNDDPKAVPNSHINVYIVELKDTETHTKIYATNPTADDHPYDFNTVFKEQYTVFPDKTVNTTEHAWESFEHFYKDTAGNWQTIKAGYHTPYRSLDFKSAYWRDGHKHSVDYIPTIDATGQEFLLSGKTKATKEFKFIPLAENVKYKKQYLEWLEKFDKLQYYTWEHFIIN